MNIIDESYEILNIPDATDRMGVLKFLEKIGRTCYKSEDKITDESCVKFINGIRDRGHWAMLEHYIFVFEVPGFVIELLQDPSAYTDVGYDYRDKLKYINCSYYNVYDSHRDNRKIGLVSASATAINYLLATQTVKSTPYHPIRCIAEYLNVFFPELIKFPDGYKKNSEAISSMCHEPSMYISDAFKPRILTRAEIKALPKAQRLLHDSMTVKFIVNRQITHEIVRHRPASYAQESTRYCNYGKKGMTFIRPNDFEVNSPEFMIWQDSMETVEKNYHKLLDLGVSVQKAASILPNSTKAELIMTARLLEWIHFFEMRADSHAHPQMREVAVPLLDDCLKNDPTIYSDLKKLRASIRLADNEKELKAEVQKKGETNEHTGRASRQE